MGELKLLEPYEQLKQKTASLQNMYNSITFFIIKVNVQSPIWYRKLKGRSGSINFSKRKYFFWINYCFRPCSFPQTSAGHLRKGSVTESITSTLKS